jgi:hypothetical protein
MDFLSLINNDKTLVTIEPKVLINNANVQKLPEITVNGAILHGYSYQEKDHDNPKLDKDGNAILDDNGMVTYHPKLGDNGKPIWRRVNGTELIIETLGKIETLFSEQSKRKRNDISQDLYDYDRIEVLTRGTTLGSAQSKDAVSRNGNTFLYDGFGNADSKARSRGKDSIQDYLPITECKSIDDITAIYGYSHNVKFILLGQAEILDSNGDYVKFSKCEKFKLSLPITLSRWIGTGKDRHHILITANGQVKLDHKLVCQVYQQTLPVIGWYNRAGIDFAQFLNGEIGLNVTGTYLPDKKDVETYKLFNTLITKHYSDQAYMSIIEDKAYIRNGKVSTLVCTGQSFDDKKLYRYVFSEDAKLTDKAKRQVKSVIQNLIDQKTLANKPIKSSQFTKRVNKLWKSWEKLGIILKLPTQYDRKSFDHAIHINGIDIVKDAILHDTKVIKSASDDSLKTFSMLS